MVDSICDNGHRKLVEAGGSSTCPDCGAPVRIICPNGHVTPTGSRYCGTCGTSVEALDQLSSFGAYASSEPTGVAQATPTASVPIAPPVAGLSMGSPNPAAFPSEPASRGNRTFLVTAIVVIAIIGVGAVGLLLFGKNSSAKTSPSTTPASVKAVKKPNSSTTSTTTPSSTTQTTVNLAAHQEAQLLSNLLSQSAGDRSAVVAATQTIAACGDVDGAIQTLNTAASSRQSLIQELNGLTVTGIPNGVTLGQTLQQAWQASLAADQSYASWGEDESFDCTPNDTGDSNYQAASGSDQTATNAKTLFSTMWASVAQQFNLPSYSPSQI